MKDFFKFREQLNEANGEVPGSLKKILNDLQGHWNDNSEAYLKRRIYPMYEKPFDRIVRGGVLTIGINPGQAGNFEANTIKKTVNEIFNKIENVEIVLVDDNSTDGTLEQIKDINKDNLKIFKREEKGLASAFLLGMINTTGEYIGWIDSNMPELTKHFEEIVGEQKSLITSKSTKIH